MDTKLTTIQTIGQRNPSADVDAVWMDALTALSKDEAVADTEAVLAALSKASKIEASVAFRIAKLVQNPLDQMVLAGLFAEGQNIALRRRLRTKGSTVYQYEHYEADEEDDPGPARVLTAACLVEWLGGSSEAWREQVAQRLLPQAGLAAKHLVLRGAASTPLEGGVRLTPFLASLLYPGDGGDERRLDNTLILSRPKERLSDVVLKPLSRTEIQAFIRLCRSNECPGRAALLWGRAGTGKTLTARAVCGELGLPLLQVRTMSFDREPFLLERAAAAAVIEGAALFFDECGRWVDSETQKHGPPPEAAMLLQILQDHPGVIMAAMNQGWLRMSEAFQRRFQVQVVYGVPEPAERAELWKRNLKRPADPEDIAQVARKFPISGGLIKNAASRLDSEPENSKVDLRQMEAAAMAQLTLALEWPELLSKERSKLKRLRISMDRETRRTLAGLGLRLRRAALLAINGNDSNHGFKACLWYDARDGNYILLLAAMYVSKIARMKPVTEVLSQLGPKEGDQQAKPKTSVNLRQNLSAAFMTGHLPVLQTGSTQEPAQVTEQGRALQDFIDFTGAGLLLSTKVSELSKKHLIGEWIQIKATKFSDVERHLRAAFPNVEFEKIGDDLKNRLLECGVSSFSTIVRWAMTRDKNALNVPPRISSAALKEALNAYSRKPGETPVFHS